MTLLAALAFLALIVISVVLLANTEEEGEIWFALVPQVAVFAGAGWYSARSPWLLVGAVLVPSAIAQAFDSPGWVSDGPPLFLIELLFAPGYALVAALMVALRLHHESRRG